MKSFNGITLISLIVTIIVMIIIAGVSISMIVGEDSAVDKSQQAKVAEEYNNKKEIIEQVLMKYNNEDYIGNYADVRAFLAHEITDVVVKTTGSGTVLNVVTYKVFDDNSYDVDFYLEEQEDIWLVLSKERVMEKMLEVYKNDTIKNAYKDKEEPIIEFLKDYLGEACIKDTELNETTAKITFQEKEFNLEIQDYNWALKK